MCPQPITAKFIFLFSELIQVVFLNLCYLIILQQVFFSAFRHTAIPSLSNFQAMTIFTHPSHLTGRITSHQCIVSNIFCYHCSGTNKGKPTYIMPTNNSGISTYGSTFLQQFFYTHSCGLQHCAGWLHW